MLAARKFLRQFLVLTCFSITGAVGAGSAEPENIIYIYTRDNYFDQEIVRQFEENTGCMVDFDYYDSVDTMFERIKMGHSGYDLIITPTIVAADLDSRGQLMNLNRTLIPNFRHLDTTLLAPFPDLEMRFHAPYTWSITGIGYLKNDVAAGDVESWDVYAQPAYRERAAMLNDGRYVIGVALKYLGYSLNTTNPNEIEAAYNTLVDWKKAIVLYGVDEPRQKLEKGKLALIQAFNGDMAASILANPDIGFSVPREGSVLNSDCFVIPEDAENPIMAHSFINHIYNPRVAAKNMSTIRYYMPNRAAQSLLPRELRSDPLFTVPRELLTRCEAIRDVGSAQPHYDRAWNSLLMDNTDPIR